MSSLNVVPENLSEKERQQFVEAILFMEKQKVTSELKQFSKENPVDWNNFKQTKLYLEYNHYNNGGILITANSFTQASTIYFSSRDIANKAVDAIGEDRLKLYYFGIVD